jgi:hypothetical protein
MLPLAVPGGPELILIALVLVLCVALAVVAVRIALLFIDYPESTETRQRIALPEHEVAELEARIEDLEAE